MYYEVRGEGEPLLLLHGGMGIGNDWRHIFASDPDGYRVIVPDLRGHGRSTNPARRFTFAIVRGMSWRCSIIFESRGPRPSA
jgi:pimeloyl-ACP methyl ester carboxylesterase